MLAFAWAIGLRLDWTEAMWINVAVYIAIFLPLSVGGLGLRDLTVLSALAWLGAPPDQALALSLLMFGALTPVHPEDTFRASASPPP